MAAFSTPRRSCRRLRRYSFTACYVAFVLTARAAARLAADFRVLGAAADRLGPMVLVLQVPIVACWLLVRPLSIVSFSACRALAPAAQSANT